MEQYDYEEPTREVGGGTNLPVRLERAWTDEQVKLIKDLVARGTSDDEFKVFLYVCKKTGLDPLARQIYAIMRKVYNPETNSRDPKMVIQTGIDGFRVVAERSGEYAGTDEPKYKYATESGLKTEDQLTAEELKLKIARIPYSASVTVYRFMRGNRVGFTATAIYHEYVQKKADGTPNDFWTRAPHIQLAKCAEAMAHRKAFPQDLSGVYAPEEIQAEYEVVPAGGNAGSRLAAAVSAQKEKINPLREEPVGQTPVSSPQEPPAKNDGVGSGSQDAPGVGVVTVQDVLSFMDEHRSLLPPADLKRFSEANLARYTPEALEGTLVTLRRTISVKEAQQEGGDGQAPEPTQGETPAIQGESSVAGQEVHGPVVRSLERGGTPGISKTGANRSARRTKATKRSRA